MRTRKFRGIILKTRNGQSTLEYATLIIILLAALLTAGVYVKRGIQGRWKQAVDDLGDQYDPQYVNSSIRHTLISNTDTQINSVQQQDPNNPNATIGFQTFRRDTTNSVETKTGTTVVGGVQAE